MHNNNVILLLALLKSCFNFFAPLFFFERCFWGYNLITAYLPSFFSLQTTSDTCSHSPSTPWTLFFTNCNSFFFIQSCFFSEDIEGQACMPQCSMEVSEQLHVWVRCSTLFEARSLWLPLCEHTQSFVDSPVPTSHLAVGALGLQMRATTHWFNMDLRVLY